MPYKTYSVTMGSKICLPSVPYPRRSVIAQIRFKTRIDIGKLRCHYRLIPDRDFQTLCA